MAIFGIGLLVDGYHRPRHWLIYFLVYHDFIQFLTVIVYIREMDDTLRVAFLICV